MNIRSSCPSSLSLALLVVLNDVAAAHRGPLVQLCCVRQAIVVFDVQKVILQNRNGFVKRTNFAAPTLVVNCSIA